MRNGDFMLLKNLYEGLVLCENIVLTLSNGIINSYFQTGFPKDVYDFIKNYDNKTFGNRLNCEVQTARWYVILTSELNVDKNRIKVCRGYYKNSQSFYGEMQPEHFFLKVDGYIFDPTAAQFGLKKLNPKNYVIAGVKKYPELWVKKILG